MFPNYPGPFWFSIQRPRLSPNDDGFPILQIVRVVLLSETNLILLVVLPLILFAFLGSFHRNFRAR